MTTQNISSTTSDKTPINGGADKSGTHADKQTPRAAEGAAKIADGAHEIASAAGSTIADKARHVRDQVDATSSSAQAKASSLTHEAGSAAKQVADRVESTARSAVSGAKDIVSAVEEEAGDLLHDARELAVEGYDYAAEVADDASDLAQRVGRQTVSFLKRSSVATGKFMSLHALPLAATGASLGWLLMSMRSRRPKTRKMVSSRRVEVQARRPRLNELGVGRPTHHEVAVTEPLDLPRDVRASREIPSTPSSKLMGVKVPDNRYGV